MADQPKKAPHVRLTCGGVEGGEPNSFVVYPDGVADAKLVEVLEDGTERPMHMHSVSSITWTGKAGEVASLQVEYLGAAIDVEVLKSRAPSLPRRPGQSFPFVDERYETDPEFRSLVQYFISFYADGRFSPSDIRSAATYAAILFEMRKPARFVHVRETGEFRREDGK